MRELILLDTRLEDATELEDAAECEERTELDDATELDSEIELDDRDTLVKTDELEDAMLLEVNTAELLVAGTDELLDVRALLLEDGILETAPLHTLPVTLGRWAGALATPLLPCTPNSTVCPGFIRSFQPMPVAV